jgi:hypothetical protein
MHRSAKPRRFQRLVKVGRRQGIAAAKRRLCNFSSCGSRWNQAVSPTPRSVAGRRTRAGVRSEAASNKLAGHMAVKDETRHRTVIGYRALSRLSQET